MENLKFIVVDANNTRVQTFVKTFLQLFFRAAGVPRIGLVIRDFVVSGYDGWKFPSSSASSPIVAPRPELHPAFYDTKLDAMNQPTITAGHLVAALWLHPFSILLLIVFHSGRNAP